MNIWIWVGLVLQGLNIVLLALAALPMLTRSIKHSAEIEFRVGALEEHTRAICEGLKIPCTLQRGGRE